MSSEIPISTKTFKLNNGHHIPAVGLGTWQGKAGSDDEKALEDSIVHALQHGYRLIDTARFYGVEGAVGRAIRASGVPREDIFVVTKLWNDDHHDPAAALKASLATLELEYLDMFLMHWPFATGPAPESKPLRIDESPTFVETWQMMEKLVGPQCRGIGVSNFTQKTLDTLLASATIVPAVNQVELHALNPNLKLVPYCEAKGIRVMGWCTLGSGHVNPKENPILTHELFHKIADAHGCSVGTVSLSWAVQRGVVIIPKSSNPARIESNIRLITLTDAEMATMNSAHEVIKKMRLSNGVSFLRVEKQGAPTGMGWTYADFGWEDEAGNWLV